MARQLLFAISLCLFFNGKATALQFDRYHSQEEINSYLRLLEKTNPSLVKFQHLGYSHEGREINYIVIGRGVHENLPALYLNGTHHGNERSSTETILALAKFLTENESQAEISRLLDHYAIYLQPLVNPDGHAKGIRYDTLGRDPNRDYSYPSRSDEQSFQIPSTKLVKQLSDKVRFHAAAAFHSGMEAVLWPWCYTSKKNADHDLFYTISRTTAQAMGIVRYGQSYADYPTGGEFIDYVYNNHGTIALTIEVSNDPSPPAQKLKAVLDRAVAGAMAFMLSVYEFDEGKLDLAKGPDRTDGPIGARRRISPIRLTR